MPNTSFKESFDKVCNRHGLTPHTLCAGDRLKCKKCATEAVSKRRRVVKIKAIEYKGGACSQCGYDKSYEALDFHHLNPDEKDFNISHNGHTRSWESTKKELDKCILICANCHREIHAKLANQTPILFQADDNMPNAIIYHEIKPTTYIEKICKQCNKTYSFASIPSNQQQFCSDSCARLNSRKVIWPTREELQDLLWKETINQIAIRYGVSGPAVRKWVKTYNLEKPERGHWHKK